MDERGVTPVLGAVALVAVATILGTTAAVYAFDLTTINEPAPSVVDADLDERIETEDPDDHFADLLPLLPEQTPIELSDQVVGHAEGDEGRWIILTHRGGDALSLAEVEVVVRLERPGSTAYRGRLVDLPLDGPDLDGHVEGDTEHVTTGPESAGGALLETSWQNEETIGFRIERPDGGPDLGEGDVLTVRVVHLPSQSIVVDRSIELQSA